MYRMLIFTLHSLPSCAPIHRLVELVPVTNSRYTNGSGRTENNTIDKYKGDAKGVQQSETPSNIAGGELLEDEQLSILTASSPR